jgi:hypothetical protein
VRVATVETGGVEDTDTSTDTYLACGCLGGPTVDRPNTG